MPEQLCQQILRCHQQAGLSSSCRNRLYTLRAASKCAPAACADSKCVSADCASKRLSAVPCYLQACSSKLPEQFVAATPVPPASMPLQQAKRLRHLPVCPRIMRQERALTLLCRLQACPSSLCQPCLPALPCRLQHAAVPCASNACQHCCATCKRAPAVCVSAEACPPSSFLRKRRVSLPRRLQACPSFLRQKRLSALPCQLQVCLQILRWNQSAG